MISTPELLLLVVVIGLVVMAVTAAMKYTKGNSSLVELQYYLKALQLRLTTPSTMDAEKERVEIDALLNRLKTTLPQKTITENEELKSLFGTTSQQIKIITDSKETGLRTSWQKLKNVVYDFDEFYYPKTMRALN